MMQPSLLGFLQNSFERFLQLNAPSYGNYAEKEYQEHGLHALLISLFPIKTQDELCSLEYVSYHLEEPRYNADVCLQRGMTFAAPIKITIRLLIWEEDEQGQRSIRNLKEQEVYFGEIPLLTKRCTFVFNGEERVLPSRLQRASVLFSCSEEGEPTALLTSWHGLQLSITKQKSGLHLQLTLPDLILPYAVLHPNSKTLHLSPDGAELYVSFDDARLGKISPIHLTSPSGEVIVAKAQRVTASAVKKLRAAGTLGVLLSTQERLAFFSAEDVFSGGELILGRGQAIIGALQALLQRGLFSVRAYSIDEAPTPPPPTDVSDASALIDWFTTTIRTFDLSRHGRLFLHYKLHSSVDVEQTNLQADDLQKIVECLDSISRSFFQNKDHDYVMFGDDPNHLGTLQLHCVGEQMLLYSWFGLMQVSQSIAARLNRCTEPDVLLPHDVVNAKPFGVAMRRFLEKCTDLLDATNSLSIVSQLRRVETPHDFISHPSHHAMLSHGELALFCRPNEFLFLEAPYFVLEDGRLRNKGAEHLSANEIEHLLQQGAKHSPYRVLTDGERKQRRSKKAAAQIELIPVSPQQALSLIEAISSNEMTRRALLAAPPLYAAQTSTMSSLWSEAVVQNADDILNAKRSGEVIVVTEERVCLVTRDLDKPLEEYLLRGLSPVVTEGQLVEAGALLAHSLTSQHGSLSLGRQVSVRASPHTAQVSASSSLVREFTSRHLLPLGCDIIEMAYGPEQLQREIPEIDASFRERLDEEGVITKGSVVREGDVLVGKYTPNASGKSNTSLCVASGQQGKVIQVELLIRKGIALGTRRTNQKYEEIRQMSLQRSDGVQRFYSKLFRELLLGETLEREVEVDGTILPAGTRLMEERLRVLQIQKLSQFCVANEEKQKRLEQLDREYENTLSAANPGMQPSPWYYDELPPGFIASVKIIIEQARPLCIGDTLTAEDGRSWCIEAIHEHDTSELLIPGEPMSEQLYLVKVTS